MSHSFEVQVVDAVEIDAIQGAWSEDRQRALLAELLGEPSRLAGEDLREMLTMALQDLDPVDCGARLLAFVMGDAMTAGMREDVAREMRDGLPWERHADMTWHRGIFDAAVMVRMAHGRAVSRPTGRQVTVAVRALDDDALAALDGPLTAAFAARLAAPCTPGGILVRLFSDALEGTSFPEAPAVVWHRALSDRDGATARLVVEGSNHWWGAAEPGQAARVRAAPDASETDG